MSTGSSKTEMEQRQIPHCREKGSNKSCHSHCEAITAPVELLCSIQLRFSAFCHVITFIIPRGRTNQQTESVINRIKFIPLCIYTMLGYIFLKLSVFHYTFKVINSHSLPGMKQTPSLLCKLWKNQIHSFQTKHFFTGEDNRLLLMCKNQERKDPSSGLISNLTESGLDFNKVRSETLTV